MFKKILAITAIFASTLSIGYANSFYLGLGGVWESVSNQSNHYQGTSPKVALGYGEWINDSFFMAGELNGEPKSIVMNNEPKNGYSLKLKYSYAASLVTGVPLDELLMAYLRLGYQNSRFEKLQVNKGGFLAGAGLGINLTRCWDLQLEYDYVTYGKINNVGTPSENEYYVGGIYRFYTF